MRKVLACLGLFVMLVLSTACNREELPTREAAFATLVPVPVETGLHLELVEVRNPFGTSPSITLLLRNYSDDQIRFHTPKYGARIFVYSESVEEWREVDDLFVSVPEGGETILVPQGEGTNWAVLINVAPDVPSTDEPVTFRVMVTGKVYRDGNVVDEEVGTYVDVTVEPW